MRRILCIISIYLLLVSSAYPQHVKFESRFSSSDIVPQPRLIYPVEDTVDLTGKEELKFKWSPHEGIRSSRSYYDFRLYNGYEMLESTLILKKRVEPDRYEFSVKADTFEDGRIYTWSLRQVYDVEGKSRRASNSFKVMRR